MPLPYIDLAKLAKDTQFATRVQFAIWRAANRIRAEDPQTPNYVARLAWAKRELAGPSASLPSTLNLVLTTGAVFNTGAAATDDQLQTIVDAMVNVLASD